MHNQFATWLAARALSRQQYRAPDLEPEGFNWSATILWGSCLVILSLILWGGR